MSIRQRTTKLIARRHDLNYFKRGSQLRIWQWWLAAVALILAAVWFGGNTFVHGSAAFSAGPMSSSHAAIGQRCELCHVPVVTSTSWTPSVLMRKHVPDSACLSCHTAPPHHPQKTMQTPTCSSCHTEHTGAMHLAATADSGCTQCHANLQSRSGELKVAAMVHSFASDHPEFRPLRTMGPADRSAAGALKFNHDVHVKAGLLGPHGPVTLACSSCHMPVAGMNGRNGSGMAPVSFEKSCRSCHALEFDRHIAAEAPHKTAEEARTFVEKSVTEFAQTHPEVVAEEIRHWPAEAPLPERAPMPPPRTQQEWVANRIARADAILWRGRCGLCHREMSDGPDATPKMEAMKQPERWFTAAVFSHPAHQAVACAECHTKALTSGSGSDVLMPSIATCRRCHDGESSPQGPPVKAGHAESGCALCHAYHGTEIASVPHEGRKLDELLKQ